MRAGERIAAASLCLAACGSIGFIAAYAMGGMRLFEGLALAAATAGFTAAALALAFGILPRRQVVDEREDFAAMTTDRKDETAEVRRSEGDLSRARTLARLFGAAATLFVVALVVPLRSLGPAIGDSLFRTKWRRGLELVREDGTPVRVRDLDVNGVVTVFPQGAIGDARSQTMLIRLPDDAAGTAQGYIAYSKVCTHAGCPVALYRSEAKELMCPCHQSVFNVLDDGAVVSGPADHALPRLPIDVRGDGYLVATGDFPVPVGPGFWERK